MIFLIFALLPRVKGTAFNHCSAWTAAISHRDSPEISLTFGQSLANRGERW
jgi:hypothetical protein